MKIHELPIRHKYGKGSKKKDIKMIRIIFTICLHLQLRLLTHAAAIALLHQTILSCDA